MSLLAMIVDPMWKFFKDAIDETAETLASSRHASESDMRFMQGQIAAYRAGLEELDRTYRSLNS